MVRKLDQAPHRGNHWGAAALQALQVELLRREPASNSHEEEFTILDIGYKPACGIWLRLNPLAFPAAPYLITLQRGSSSSACRPGADAAGLGRNYQDGPTLG
jgi:hypothetical protein